MQLENGLQYFYFYLKRKLNLAIYFSHSPMRIGILADQRFYKNPKADWNFIYFQNAAIKLNINLQLLWWQDPKPNWSSYDAVVIRSTWDYVARCDKFLKVCHQISQQTNLYNDIQTVKWNCDKIYLKGLSEKGLPSIPTQYAANEKQALLAIQQALKKSQQIVVKPTIGCGSQLAGKAKQVGKAMQLAHTILKQNKAVMIQPYLKNVQIEGQKSIILIDGQISHGIRKIASLAENSALKSVVPTQITQQMRDFVVSLSQIDNKLYQYLYARVDILSDGEQIRLMELQLIQPFLFLQFKQQGAEKLLQAVIKRVQKSRKQKVF